MALQWRPVETQDTTGEQPLRLGTWLRTDRARVPGGWLVRSFLVKRDKAPSVGDSPEEIEINANIALAFVPDAAGTWTP